MVFYNSFRDSIEETVLLFEKLFSPITLSNYNKTGKVVFCDEKLSRSRTRFFINKKIDFLNLALSNSRVLESAN